MKSEGREILATLPDRVFDSLPLGDG